MRSTGEVMGLDEDLGIAYAKTQMAAKPSLPLSGNVFLSVCDRDKEEAVQVAQDLVELGFEIYSTSGTAKKLEAAGVDVGILHRLSDGARPNVRDLMKNGKMDLIINTPRGQMPRKDENQIRTEAVMRSISIMTTLASAKAAVQGIKALNKTDFKVKSIQDYIG
jgi:carbamoyl-phosphate synthase large subunit